MRVVLASTSPRRRELFALLQVPFEVADPAVEEQPERDQAPADQALRFAARKARSCAERFPDRLVLGSDTLIAVDRAVLGKPADLAEAAMMLRRLSGRVHVIHTAVALLRNTPHLQDLRVETVRVWMKPLSETDVEAYLRTGEGLGKAGAYSIQGRGGALIERIEGDYPAVVGLPLRLVAAMLQRHGVPVPADVETLYRTQPYPNWARFSSETLNAE